MSFSATYPHDLPVLPPPSIQMTDSLNSLLLKARTELAELKGYSIALPNPMLLLSPAIIKEALASSEIENINTTIERVLQQQLFPETEQKTENKEVIRYKEAIEYGFENMSTLSLSNRLIRGIHNVLLAERSYGYKTYQNHIENSTTKEIIYTPPSATEIERLIANWEQYAHNNKEDKTDPLIKCAILHYQFEAIHPFNDGNGRTGRILMVLYLIYCDLLHFPILYISGYINRYRTKYYELLQNVTTKQDWIPYIEFMLKAFLTQSLETSVQLFSFMALFYETKEKIKKQCKNIYNSDLVEFLFYSPIVTPVRLGNLMGVHYTTATRYLKELEKNNFVENKKVGKYQLYINTELIKILQPNYEEMNKRSIGPTKPSHE